MANNRDGEVECFLTHKEVAEILTKRGYPTTSKVAWHLERQAFRKIANHPIIRALAKDMGLPIPDELDSA